MEYFKNNTPNNIKQIIEKFKNIKGFDKMSKVDIQKTLNKFL